MEEETDQGSDYGEEIIGRNNLEVGIIDFCPENETAYQHVWRSTEFSSCVILQIAEPLGLLEENRTAVGKVDVEITAGHTTLAHGTVLHFVALDCMCRRPN
jgi:hypothetical protein